jgi:hypothetical protein
MRHLFTLAALALACAVAPASAQQVPQALAAPGLTAAATLHAEGAQVYECKADANGKLAWQFREPIATLLRGTETAGHHYVGPTWEANDGSAVVGKAVANVPGTSPADIPWLKLEVVMARGSGLLSGVSIVQRINTHGGVVNGFCNQAGDFYGVAYSADYVFLRK